MQFRVPQDKIKNGNAVIAVTKGGTVVWSWHLWFDHDDVLTTIPCTNFQGVTYNFTKQTLGFAYRQWKGSTYDKPRVARIKVEQEIANGGTKQTAVIDITQNPGSVKEISSTFYQFGRKDALPGIDAIADGSFTQNGGDNMSIQNGILHPEVFYTYGSSWYSGYNHNNLWSMDNTTTGYNDNAVIKTIYDPCPAGFKMPASNAFTGFTLNGQNGGTPNTNGTWDYGCNFNNKVSSPDATVYFPASGWRVYVSGQLDIVGYYGWYWSGVPNASYGCSLFFSPGSASPQYDHYRQDGHAVRPVAE